MSLDFSKIVVILLLLAFAGLLWWQEDVFEDAEIGHPRVVDGDSLEFRGERVRLIGIDAPEGRQYCQKEGKDWACGRASTKALKRVIGGQKVTCDGRGFDQHDRLLAVCRTKSVELNRWMVEEGWAVSYGGRYLNEQRRAKEAAKGLWQGAFDMPRDWRRKNR